MCDTMHKLRSALNKHTSCDVTLKLKSGIDFKCHSLILTFNGTFFESKFRNEWSGNDYRKEIDCIDFDDEYVIGIVKFMYGIPFPLSENNVKDYLACAVYFGVDDCSNYCDKFLEKNMTVGNVFNILRIADGNGRVDLTHTCYNFIDKNFEKCVSASDDFCLLSKELVLSIVKRRSLSHCS